MEVMVRVGILFACEMLCDGSWCYVTVRVVSTKCKNDCKPEFQRTKVFQKQPGGPGALVHFFARFARFPRAAGSKPPSRKIRRRPSFVYGDADALRYALWIAVAD